MSKQVDRRNFIKYSALAGVSAFATLATACNDGEAEETGSEVQDDFPVDEKMGILMDNSLCVECQACRVACQNENELPVEQALISFKSKEVGSYPDVKYHFSRHSCMHCEDAVCKDGCPVDALSKTEQGFTTLDFESCIGCGMCEQSCPYGVPSIFEEKMYKCDACQHLVTVGESPACVSTCAANAIKYGTYDDLVKAAQQRVETLQERYPEASLYGLEEQDGLSLLLILKTEASKLELI
ncbi:4Fe-4S dicluster domain-containing protein [Fuchsiella alkaliacetigena]|uniref:4Fe-4S dicluster domain-containing protein n=1 Tax=Fuchsiella alkaliacetigena TaxID=957042 RepID=UPI002009F1EF|nr:4Fe-4S dicluster domain-containing protein [Fuchsiella alkaliacetigena]MCK8825006.1 4Fe-4S binding protein [Fuchsiella alkaliacetigena]